MTPLTVWNDIFAQIGDRATELGIRAVEAIKAKTKNMHVEFLYLDLGSFKDIREFAGEISRRTDTVDLLINSKFTLRGHERK